MVNKTNTLVLVTSVTIAVFGVLGSKLLWLRKYDQGSSGARSVLRTETTFRARQHTRVACPQQRCFVASSRQDDGIELGA
eukprot:scaffold3226_cov63-Phaeocystis_antarctica.AAC.2